MTSPLTTPAFPMPIRRRVGFTLIELLTVIMIIGILAAMLFPAITGVRKKARHADAQTAFSQWATGITRYKQVYGFFPNLGATGTAPDTTLDTLYTLETADTNLKFVKALSGRSPTGLALATVDRKALNRNAEEFCAFGKNDFEDFANFNDNSLVVDRFGNRHIRVIFDTDSTGTIKNITPAAGTDSIPGDIKSISSATGLPARVIIYTTDLGKDFESYDGLGATDFDQVIAIQ